LPGNLGQTPDQPVQLATGLKLLQLSQTTEFLLIYLLALAMGTGYSQEGLRTVVGPAADILSYEHENIIP